jgi:hypothetical protein
MLSASQKRLAFTAHKEVKSTASNLVTRQQMAALARCVFRRSAFNLR